MIKRTTRWTFGGSSRARCMTAPGAVGRLAFVGMGVLAIACSGGGAKAEAPRVRDVWYVYVAGEQTYGSEHITVQRQGDGTYCYQVESRLLVELLGQRQEMSTKAKYVVTSEYRPISIEAEDRSLSGQSRLEGCVKGEYLELVYRRGELRRTASIGLAKSLLLRVCLEDWLNGQPGTSPATCQILNEASLQMEPAVAIVGETGELSTTWKVDFGPELGRGRVTIDPEGIRKQTTWDVPPTQLRRATAEEATKIGHRVLAGREILMFPIHQPIGAPHLLTSLRVRLSWKEVGWERFRLEDERQKVVSRSEEAGRYSVLLRICPVEPTDTGQGFPVEGDEYREALSETRFIKPKDAEIVQQAREWIGAEKTALGAVRALCAAVFKHMQGGTMIAETLSGPEVLQSKQGKCSEHAILFASLARSAGIPTRIVLGMRMLGGAWVGHMWDEAYVGRWVTVDCTANEVGGNVALLKLIDSDSVLGTQGLRWELTKSLEVEVEDFEPRPNNAEEAIKTGIDGRVYTNAPFACRLTAPDANWSIVDTTKPNVPGTTIRFKVPKRDDVLIHFVPLSLPVALSPAVLTEIRLARLKTMLHGFEVLKNEDHRVHQMSGRLVVFRRAAGKNDTKMLKTTEVIWSDGSSCFLLNLIAPEAAHDECLAEFLKLVESFESLRKPR